MKEFYSEHSSRFCINLFFSIPFDCAASFQHGASINASNNKGNTALHEAVIEKHVFVVELLLLHGASVQLLNKRQCTAIDYAEQVMGRAPSSFPAHFG